MPSEEVHEIIDKLCKANQFSQSKVTGLLVEEALRSRGLLGDSFSQKKSEKKDFINDIFDEEQLSQNNRSSSYIDVHEKNKKLFPDDIKMMHEFVEYKYFKRIMRENNGLS